MLIVVFVAGLAFCLGWQLKPDGRAQRADAERATDRTIRELRENARTNVRLAAVANYQSGYADGIVEFGSRILGRRADDRGAVYDGNVPVPLRRWVEDVIARTEEHS